MEALTSIIRTPSFTEAILPRINTYAANAIKVTGFVLSFIAFIAEVAVRVTAAAITSPALLFTCTGRLPKHLLSTAKHNARLAFGLNTGASPIYTEASLISRSLSKNPQTMDFDSDEVRCVKRIPEAVLNNVTQTFASFLHKKEHSE